jgi:hypothetical protein
VTRFLCTHTMPANAFTYEDVCQIAEAGQHDTNVRGYRAFLNLSEGKACCIVEAHDRDAVVGWYRRMNIPFDTIVPVEFEADRGTIEDLRQVPVGAGTS